MSKDTAIKAGTYCPVCRGISGTDCWHDANQFHAGSGYLEKLLKAKDEIEALKQQVEQGKRDAERYQYIKRTTGASRDGFHNVYIDLPEGWACGSIAQHYEEAIDLAIAAAPKQEN